ncbi:hypothetical protein CEXT_605121 [Caerostris extrusa]|uniref:Uncharacterized protein n=1 Tax=Caerostris extrusa TaxID=172846 RepID=A0AAV4UD78_CAEEX|nr:hypothetical protein CEXT_605121 [Caerostris extrusa]
MQACIRIYFRFPCSNHGLESEETSSPLNTATSSPAHPQKPPDTESANVIAVTVNSDVEGFTSPPRHLTVKPNMKQEIERPIKAENQFPVLENTTEPENHPEQTQMKTRLPILHAARPGLDTTIL